MGLISELFGWKRAKPSVSANVIADMAQRRSRATTASEERRTSAKEATLGMGGSVLDSDGDAFQPYSGGGTRRMMTRDLSLVQQDKMLQIAWYLYETNPFARRIIEMMRDLVVGEGYRITAKDPVVSEWLTRWWEHPLVQFDKRLPTLYLAFSLNGELIFPVAVNPIDGFARFGYLDPLQLKGVRHMESNSLVVDQIVLKSTSGALEGQAYKVVRRNEVTNEYEGDVFYFTANALPNSGRGRSDLLAVADWLDVYDQHVFAQLEQLKAAASYVWDVEVDSTIQKEIDAERKLIEGAPPGFVYAHNKSKKLEAKSPVVHGSDRAEAAKMIAIHIAGSVGFPISWLGFTDSNRATIEGQNDVLMKTPARRQKEFVSVISDMAQYSLMTAVRTNPVLFAGVKDFGFTVEVPEIAAKDISRVGAAMMQLVSALDTAQLNKTMSRKTAIRIQTLMFQHLGVKVDPADLQEEIDQETEDDADDDATRAALAARQKADGAGAAAPFSGE